LLRRAFALLVLVAVAALAFLVYYGKGWPLAGGVPSFDFGPVSRRLEDAKTTAEVRAAFGLSRSLSPHALAVATERGVVTLRGTVPREDLRRRAESRALAVPGVRQVVNHIEVGAPSKTRAGPAVRTLGEALDDGALAVKVKLALSLRRELDGAGVLASVKRRRVTLTGDIAREDQRRVAVETAGEVGGVEGVTDELRLRGQTSSATAAGARVGQW
jgi:hyperosmotically inducible protein